VKIAIASGKGGTGKTTLAIALAVTAARRGWSAAYADCDVEAPNGHLLLHPHLDVQTEVTRPIPSVDPAACRRCGACAKACQFGAIVLLGTRVKVYPELCKSCGACVAACPWGAIRAQARRVGHVDAGHAASLQFIRGTLDVGRARSIPVIEAAKAAIGPAMDLVVLDAPPGTSCPMLATVRGCDLVILVAEATAFGLADLTAAADAVRAIKLPVAVVINRCDIGDQRVHEFCASRGLPVLAEIPYSIELARGYASADIDAVVDTVGDTMAHILGHLMSASHRRAS
jgi:MinD superfamily P-loop ATPase